MKVTIRVFAFLQEQLGTTVTVELPGQTTITELKARVTSLDPQVAETVAKARVAINQEFVNGPAITLTGHEEVALIPPVSGG